MSRKVRRRILTLVTLVAVILLIPTPVEGEWT